MNHPVVDALRSRPPGARIALVVEGGGMRGAVSAGMALGLHELGLDRAFDAAYGSSAGALNAFWLVSGRARDGLPTWFDVSLNRQLINRRRAARGQPVLDTTQLIEERYEQLSPGLFEAALASPTELHPMATDVATAESVDLHPEIRDAESLRLALRASVALPLLAGPPVELAGRRFLDAGLSAAIPYHAAVAGGATHVLVLRSRIEGEVARPSGRASTALTARMLRRIDPAVATAFVTRATREAEDEALLARHDADASLTPHILSVRPPAGSPVPSRLEKDVQVVRDGLEAGRRALHDLIGS